MYAATIVEYGSYTVFNLSVCSLRTFTAHPPR